MVTTIDAAGRIVVPKAIREEARLSPGMPLEIRCHDGVVELEPVPLAVSLKRRGRVLVAMPEAAVPPLTAEAVEATCRRLRRDRGTEQALARALPDTSVLVAAFCSWHEHHAPAASAVDALLGRRDDAVLAGHVLVETYAVLTRLPPPHRIAPAAAMALLRGNLGRLRVVTLDGRATWSLLDDLAGRRIAGGRSYDALVVACAVRAGAERVLTLNRRHFEALLPDGITVDCPLPAQ